METISAHDGLDAIVTDIQNLILSKNDFIGFVYLSIAIEFLGSFFDNKSFDTEGLSKKRFNRAIKYLFDKTIYKQGLCNNDCSTCAKTTHEKDDCNMQDNLSTDKSWLYTNYRNSIAHMLRPGAKLLLTSRCCHNATTSMHLAVDNNKIVFVLEDLFSDFKNSVNKVKELISTNNILIKRSSNTQYMYTIQLNDIGDGKSITTSGGPV